MDVLLDRSSDCPKFEATLSAVMLPALIFDASTASAASLSVVIAPAAMLLARIVAEAISFAVIAPAAMRSAEMLRSVSEPPSMVAWESCGVPLAALIV